MAYFIPANEMSTASPQNGMQKHQWHITGMQKTPNNSMISQILPRVRKLIWLSESYGIQNVDETDVCSDVICSSKLE